MSKAIHYINLGFDQDINQKTTALNASMPAQTVNIPVDEILIKPH